MSENTETEIKLHQKMFKKFMNSFHSFIAKKFDFEQYKKKGINFVEPETNQTALHLFLKYGNFQQLLWPYYYEEDKSQAIKIVEYLIKKGCQHNLNWEGNGSCLQIFFDR